MQHDGSTRTTLVLPKAALKHPWINTYIEDENMSVAIRTTHINVSSITLDTREHEDDLIKLLVQLKIPYDIQIFSERGIERTHMYRPDSTPNNWTCFQDEIILRAYTIWKIIDATNNENCREKLIQYMETNAPRFPYIWDAAEKWEKAEKKKQPPVRG